MCSLSLSFSFYHPSFSIFILSDRRGSSHFVLFYLFAEHSFSLFITQHVKTIKHSPIQLVLLSRPQRHPFACRSVRGYALVFQIAPHVSSTACSFSISFSMVSVHPPIYQLHRALLPNVPSGVPGTDKMRSTQDWIIIAKGPGRLGWSAYLCVQDIG